MRGRGVERRSYRSRTCDTLIRKSGTLLASSKLLYQSPNKQSSLYLMIINGWQAPLRRYSTGRIISSARGKRGWGHHYQTKRVNFTTEYTSTSTTTCNLGLL